MKITIEHYGEVISHDFGHDDVTLPRVLQAFAALLIVAGFFEKQIKEYFADGESPLEWDTE